jgi:hypothetical protein
MNIIDEILIKFKNKKGGINTQKIRMSENLKYLNALIDITNFLPIDTHLRFRFNYIKNGYINKSKNCKECGKILVDVKNNFCSSTCSNKNLEEIERMTSTWNNKTKNEISKIQEKRKKTNIEKYGIDIASKLPEVIEKNKQTHIQNWGDYAMRNAELLKKRNNTYIERHGGIGMGSNSIYKKVKQTTSERYGVEYFSKTNDWYDKCVNSALLKYGQTWTSKVDYINSRQQSGGFSYYDFEFPSGKVVRVQGYEPKVLAKLVIDYDEDNIVVGVQDIINCIGFFHYEYEGETHRYYPDIYIKSENRVIEVKSTYTFNKEKEKNLLKRDSVLNKGINFNFIIL